MRFSRAVLAACLSLAVIPARAADLEAGHKSAATCQACHGADGVSKIATVPSLAGQREKFLGWQLVFFRSGRRVNEIMGPLSANLSDEDIRNISAWFASLPQGKPAVTNPDPALRQQGQQVAQTHRCAACHTDTYGGNQAAPAIAHQHKEYLVKALTDYRSAARPSVGVAAMTEAASGLSDDDIRAVATFLESYE